MSLDPNAVGLQTTPTRVSWTSKDAILYALGVGAGIDDLRYTTENTRDLPQAVLPTFAITIGLPTNILREVGPFDWGRLVHGGQTTRLFGPLPVDGSAEVVERVVAIDDKGEGKNAVVTTAATIIDCETNRLLAEVVMTVVIRGAGGFGGTSRPSDPQVQIPSNAPDYIRHFSTTRDQALLYRLSGDRNPLHSDPNYAIKRAGFPGPILHGLCTYGFAGRAVLDTVCDDDVARFGELSGRFSKPVFPGEDLAVKIWRQPDGALFQVTAGTDERVVFDGGRFSTVAASRDTDRPQVISVLNGDHDG